MGSTTVASGSTRIASTLRSLLVLAFALAWIAASGSVHAKAKDKSMCDGLKGAAKGVCTAAAALGCGEPTKHQKQCDALGDKFETLTGDLPPWEEPVDPPPPPPTGKTVTLMYDSDAFDLDTEFLCEDALGAACNQDAVDSFREPNDFTLSLDVLFPDEAILVLVQCDDVTATVEVTVLRDTPFADVNVSTPLDPQVLSEVAFTSADTIVVRTCNGGFFKIGNVDVGFDRATVAYEQLF